MQTVTRIKRGLDLPISGRPEQKIGEANPVSQVGIVADDYIGMRPTMAVREGDRVTKGQLLFDDKKTPGVRYTSPAAGRVAAINRGAKRRFLSVVVDVEGDEELRFPTFQDYNLYNLERQTVVENLLESGLWTALRTRPYSKVPSPESSPHSLFVTAIDTNPLAPDPTVVLNEQADSFVFGLQVLSTLTDGTTYLCKAAGAEVPGTDQTCVEVAEFSGLHPAGLAGTHIHFLDPVNESKTVWYIGYQDVIAMGKQFIEGSLWTERVVSVAGPAAANPRLLRTRAGASLDDLTKDEISGDEVRVISGSVLSGRKSAEQVKYLGRYANQVSLLREGRTRDFMGWLTVGMRKFSVKRVFASAVVGRGAEYEFTSSTEGSRRAIVPVGSYERVMPLDIIATPLMKALAVGDWEQAQTLGCLELDEEDVALCTYVCPGKHDYGTLLRDCLTTIELEG